MKGPTLLNVTRSEGTAKLLVTATALLWLGGCATGGGSSVQTSGLPEPAVDSRYSDWFDGGLPPDMDSMDWGRIDMASQAVESGNTRDGIAQLQALAEQGYRPAYYELAKVYDQGLGVARDPAKAAELYGEAIRDPSPIQGYASLNLARLYLAGDGVARDETLAYRLVKQAVETGTGESAEDMMGDMLAQGQGVPADPAVAIKFYESAAEQNHEGALRALAEAYSENGWYQQNPNQSRTYARRYAGILEKKANAGDVGAMVNLASLYSQNGLLEPDPEKRRQWLMRAADSGNPEALAETGEMLLSSGDTQRGLDLLRQAANAGDVEAMEHLGNALLGRMASVPTRARPSIG
ncbi:tetratricopeptide repeat protein [Modicisalibacter luteus]|uniref:tetratricopeptide repeat protein n=1 Tax=Modicisalibacter luteus TaxID=453962 RepID=UPI0036370E59